MPDDVKTEVTEQEGEVVVEGADEGFSAGFEEESLLDKKAEEKEPDKKEPLKEEAKKEKEAPKEEEKAAEKPKREKPAKVKKETEKKVEEEPEKKSREEDSEDELDEDEKRGKELLEAEEKKADEEKKAKEEAEREKKGQDKKAGPSISQPIELTPELANVFLGFVDPKLLPESIKVGDTEITDLREYAEANPEVSLLAGNMVTNVIQRLVDAGILMTQDLHKAAIDEMRGETSDTFFHFQVQSRLPENVEAEKLWGSKDFQEYHEKAPDTFKALFRSDDPMDHVRGFKRYLAKTTKEVKEKVKEIDSAAEKKKKAHEDIHGSTIRSGRAAVSNALSGDVDEEFSAGFNEAAAK